MGKPPSPIVLGILADLKQSRQVNPGAVYIAGRDTCTGRCESTEGCNCWHPMPAEACTELGVESMLRYRRTTSTVAWGIALVLVLVMAVYMLQTFDPLI